MNLPQKNDQNALANLFDPEKLPDTVSAWAKIYFRIEVTTSERSRKEQQRDLQLFIDFPVSDDRKTGDPAKDPPAHLVSPAWGLVTKGEGGEARLGGGVLVGGRNRW